MESNGPEEALVHFERAESALKEVAGDSLTGRVWFGLGIAGAAVHGELRAQTAWDNLVMAFDWFLEHGDEEAAVAVARYPVSIIALSHGTVDLFERALQLVPPHSVDAGWLAVRLGVALISDRGDFAGASRIAERALTIGRDTGHEQLEARAQYVIGNSRTWTGDYVAALTHFRAGLDLTREHGDLQSKLRRNFARARKCTRVGWVG